MPETNRSTSPLIHVQSCPGFTAVCQEYGCRFYTPGSYRRGTIINLSDPLSRRTPINILNCGGNRPDLALHADMSLTDSEYTPNSD